MIHELMAGPMIHEYMSDRRLWPKSAERLPSDMSQLTRLPPETYTVVDGDGVALAHLPRNPTGARRAQALCKGRPGWRVFKSITRRNSSRQGFVLDECPMQAKFRWEKR